MKIIQEFWSIAKLMAAVVENGYISICKGTWKIRVEKVVNIPLTFGGRAIFNIQNILPAVLAAYLRDVKIEDMKVALDTFIPGSTQTPGRMNLFKFKNFEILIDYAHNTAGFQAIARFLEKVDAECKVGVIAGVGDRRDEDIVNLGRYAANMFDEIIIRQDRNLRGRSDQEIIDLMVSGIKEVNADKKYIVIPKESEAIDYAIKNAAKGSFITICSDVVPDALEQIQRYKEEEDGFKL
jgi:cyanophycin synthetase